MPSAAATAPVHECACVCCAHAQDQTMVGSRQRGMLSAMYGCPADSANKRPGPSEPICIMNHMKFWWPGIQTTDLAYSAAHQYSGALTSCMPYSSANIRYHVLLQAMCGMLLLMACQAVVSAMHCVSAAMVAGRRGIGGTKPGCCWTPGHLWWLVAGHGGTGRQERSSRKL